AASSRFRASQLVAPAGRGRSVGAVSGQARLEPPVADVENVGEGLGSSDERGAEVVEAGDLGGPSGEEAGVDESGDGRADRDGGDDGDAEDGAGVSCGEGASGLGEEDDAGRPEVGEGDEGGEGEVAGAADDGVATPVSGQRLDGGCAPGVDDGHGVARAFQAGDGEARS